MMFLAVSCKKGEQKPTEAELKAQQDSVKKADEEKKEKEKEAEKPTARQIEEMLMGEWTVKEKEGSKGKIAFKVKSLKFNEKDFKGHLNKEDDKGSWKVEVDGKSKNMGVLNTKGGRNENSWDIIKVDKSNLELNDSKSSTTLILEKK